MTAGYCSGAAVAAWGLRDIDAGPRLRVSA
jgi:hypothetical protein